MAVERDSRLFSREVFFFSSLIFPLSKASYAAMYIEIKTLPVYNLTSFRTHSHGRHTCGIQGLVFYTSVCSSIEGYGPIYTDALRV